MITIKLYGGPNHGETWDVDSGVSTVVVPEIGGGQYEYTYRKTYPSGVRLYVYGDGLGPIEFSAHREHPIKMGEKAPPGSVFVLATDGKAYADCVVTEKMAHDLGEIPSFLVEGLESRIRFIYEGSE